MTIEDLLQDAEKKLGADINPFPRCGAAVSGVQRFAMFNNGYGASIVKCEKKNSYGENLYEVAVMKLENGNWSLCHDSPIRGNKIGNLKVNEIFVYLDEISKL